MKLKYFSLSCGTVIYAVIAIYLLSHISPKWDTIPYLIAYILLSYAWFFFLNHSFSSATFSIIVFSLVFSLIRLSDEIIAGAFSFHPQKLYYFVFFTVVISGSFYYFLQSFRVRNILSFRARRARNLPQRPLAPAGLGMTNQSQAASALGMKWANILRWLWQEKRFVALIFLFGLAVRALFAVQLTLHLPPGVMGGPDSQYQEDALRLAQTGNIFDATMPFLSQKGSVVLFYALIYKIFGNHLLIAHLFNALLGAICVLFTYFIAKFIFDETAAKIAAILTAGYGFLIQYGGYIGSEAVGLFTIELFLLALFLTKRGRTPISYALAFLSGISLTLLVMARPEYYYSLIIIFPWMIYFLRKSKIKILCFTLGFLLIALPWMYRNFLTFGDFTLSSIASSVETTQQSLLYQTWFYEFKKFQEAGISVSNFGQMVSQIFHHPLLSVQIIWPHLWGQFAKFWDYDIFFTPAFIFLQPKSSAYNLILCFFLYCFMIAGMCLSVIPSAKREESRQRFFGTAPRVAAPQVASSLRMTDTFSYSFLLLFLILFKTLSYMLTTSSTMFDPTAGIFAPDDKDWYRFTIVPLTHVFMGGGIAKLCSYVVANSIPKGEPISRSEEISVS